MVLHIFVAPIQLNLAGDPFNVCFVTAQPFSCYLTIDLLPVINDHIVLTQVGTEVEIARVSK